MSRNIFSQADAFRFIKVENYFERYKEWNTLDQVLDHQFDDQNYILKLKFNVNGNEGFFFRMEFIDDDIFRLRFNPSTTNFKQNTRAVILDKTQLSQNLSRKIICKKLTEQNRTNSYLFIQCKKSEYVTMVVLVHFNPFQIEVKYIGPNYNGEPLLAPTIWRTALPGIYYTPNGRDDYAIIQAIQKPAYAKYVGFGEQGGISLGKNNQQLNYFNFDNMRYMQIYNKGPLDTRQPLYHSEPMFFEYNSVPGVKIANALFVANPGQVLLDLGYLNSQRYMLGTRVGDLDYYFFIGQDTKSLVYNYTSVVGRSKLKPRYVLGYHQGCYGYQRRDIVQWAVNKHRQYKIPLDGMHIDVDIQHKYQTFTIDTGKFPNPQEMFTNLRKKGIKCSTNITPVISREDQNYQTYRQGLEKNFFVLDKRYDANDPQSRNYQLYGGGNQYRPNDPNNIEGYNSGKPFVGGVYYGNQGNVQLGSSGHYPDFGRLQVRKWWGNQYKYLMDSGLEFIWQDMTTPAIRDRYGDMKSFPARLMITSSYYTDKGQKDGDLTPFIRQWNLYSYNLHKATYFGLNQLESRNNKRNFIIGRGSFTGSHRFAGLWTGDNSSTWNFLRTNVSQALSLGLCGVVINGQDIGGFQQDKDYQKWADPELLIRWTAAGAFLPWFRNHYVRKGRKEFQQVFMYEQYFKERNLPIPQPQDLYQMVLPICKHFIELRYHLLQLFYDLMFENTLTGLPICRPLFFEASSDQTLFNDKEKFLNNQFFVGKDMLVAPILWPRFDKGVDTRGVRNVYLPSGSNWYHFKNNTQPLSQRVQGGITIRDFDASLNPNFDHINYIVPIYIKEGGIIPTIQLQQYVGELHDNGQQNPITFNIYPGNYFNQKESLLDNLLDQSEGYSCYLDDGVSRSSASTESFPSTQGGDKFAKDEFRKTKVSHVTIVDGQFNLNFGDHHIKKIVTRNVLVKRYNDKYTPIEKYFFVAFLHSPEENIPLKEITINGKSIHDINQGTSAGQRPQQLWESNENAWYYNENLRTSFVKVFDTQPSLLVVAHYHQ